MANVRYGRLMIGALAAQLMLGCQKVDEDLGPAPKKVDVPTGLDHPAEFVGIWQEAKGKQSIDLKPDGVCEIKQQISISAQDTHGAPQDFATKIPCKWGTKTGKFYFTDIAGSVPLSYDYKVSSDKIAMEASGSKLVYTRIKDSKDKKK